MTTAGAIDGKPSPGIVVVRRSLLRVLARVVRDPLGAVPPQAYSERMVLTRTAGRLRAYLSDPLLIQEALVHNAAKLGKSREMKRVLGWVLGDGLLTADGASWRWQRRTLAPGFQPDALTALTAPMIAAAEATRDGWLRQGDGGPLVVDVGQAMMRATSAIILDTMLSGRDGLTEETIERAMGDFLAATPWMFALAILDAPRRLPFPGRARAEAARQLMRRLMRERIAARRRVHGVDGRSDLVATLLAARDPETGRALADDEVADNILTFVAAGHETTALALTWTLSLLADHPGCAARLRAEIGRVTGGGAVTPAHIGELGYARQVVGEAMRLYPPAPLLARRVSQAFTLGGIDLPAGSILYVPIHAVHRHAAFWPEPDRFDPERFAPEEARGRHRFAYLPFGAGPRVCIGSGFALDEAVAILAVIAARFAVERIEPPPAPRMRVTLRPARPMQLRLVPLQEGTSR